MSNSLTSGFLENLAKVSSNETVFTEKAGEIKSIVQEAKSYESVNDALDTLKDFDYRIPEEAMDIVTLVFQIDGSNLEYENDLLKRYKTDLRLETFPILESIAYQNTEEVVGFLWKCLNNEKSEISERARETLKKIASYNINIYRHCGFKVQSAILNHLKRLGTKEVIENIDAVLELCSEILSLELTSSDAISANEISLNRASMPASNELKTLRSNTFDLLKNLYSNILYKTDKRRIINVLNSMARHGYRGTAPSQELLDLINEDIRKLLDFYEEITLEDDKELLQKIGHNLYWLNYHHAQEYNDSNIQKILKIRDELYSNEEQNIFNVLVGFEAVFPFQWDNHEWKVEEEKKYKEDCIDQYLSSMGKKNYAVWQSRILEYVKIKSNDLATFIYFGQFLKELGIRQPTFAKNLLSEHHEKLGEFRTPLVEGLLDSDRDSAMGFLGDWLDQGIHLQSICVLLGQTNNVDLEFYASLFDKAKEQGDQIVLNLFLGPLAERYNDKEDTIPLVISTILELTKYKDARWVNVYWWRKNLDLMAKNFGGQEVDIILSNLLYADSIGIHEEWVLSPLAINHPKKLVKFFKKRIKQGESNSENYNDIPFRFDSRLRDTLQEHLELFTKEIIGWMHTDDYNLRRKALSVLHAITGDSFCELTNYLPNGLKLNNTEDLDILIQILNDYAGELETEDLWKQILKANPDKEVLKEECIGHFLCTGSTCGFDGVAIKFKNREKMFKNWQTDDDEYIRSIGIEGAKYFKTEAKREYERVNERQQLQEHDFKNNN